MQQFLKKILLLNIIIIASVGGMFFGSIFLVDNPADYLPDRIDSRYERVGGAVMYGYTFVNWESLMQSPQQEEYIDLVVEGLDFGLVHAQWSVVGRVDNETLDEDYLENLTAYIDVLGSQGRQVVIHTWVSSYSPAWLYSLVPELVGTDDRWQGIPLVGASTQELEHRQILKGSMIYYHERLCEYFIAHNVDQYIRGWCLDDETQSENWNDFFHDITTTLLSYNASWRIGAMFNRIDKFHLTGETGMTVNYFDPYDQDPRFIQKIHYAYDNSGVSNLSVLIDAMGGHTDEKFHNKMRRQAWIAWFMGVDEIGWYTYLYGTDEWACIQWNNGNGPISTGKTMAALNAKIDVNLLNDAYAKIAQEGDSAVKDALTTTLLDAYQLAKINNFEGARALVQEVLA